MLANVAIGFAIKRDPASQTKLTFAAVGVTVLAVSILLPTPGHLHLRSRNAASAVYSPSATPTIQALPATREYRRL